MWRLLKQLGIDDWVLVICGFAAIVFAVLDFAQIIQLTQEAMLTMILTACGMMMGATVAQSIQRNNQVDAVLGSLDTSKTESIDSTDYNSYIKQNIYKAKRFVADTTLHQVAAPTNFCHPIDVPNHFANALYKRLQKKEITFWCVETIPSKERLEWVIYRLLVFQGLRWYIRYYDSNVKPIPALNIMSFDNEIFIIGSFYGNTIPGEGVTDVSINNPKICYLLTAYWNNLWLNAKPLNEGDRINWDELKAIGVKLGIADIEFDAMINRLKLELQKPKYRIK
jgi:hypothetical protein